MQMSTGHLLAAGLDRGNSMIFAFGENVIKSRLAEDIYSVVFLSLKPSESYDSGGLYISSRKWI